MNDDGLIDIPVRVHIPHPTRPRRVHWKAIAAHASAVASERTEEIVRLSQVLEDIVERTREIERFAGGVASIDWYHETVYWIGTLAREALATRRINSR